MKTFIITKAVNVISGVLLTLICTNLTQAQPTVDHFEIKNQSKTFGYGGMGSDGIPLNQFVIEFTFGEDIKPSVAFLDDSVNNRDKVAAMLDLLETATMPDATDLFDSGNLNTSPTNDVDVLEEDIGGGQFRVTIVVRLQANLLPNTHYTLRINKGGVRNNADEEIDEHLFTFTTASAVDITPGTAPTICSNGNAAVITPILIAESHRYSFVRNESGVLVVAFDNPLFRFGNTDVNEITISTLGGGTINIGNVSLLAGNSALSFEFSLGDDDNLNALLISNLKVIYAGVDDQNASLVALNTNAAYLMSGLFEGGASKALATVNGTNYLDAPALNLNMSNITGENALCLGSFATYQYFVTPVEGASSYIWNVPDQFNNPTGEELVDLGGGLWQTPNNMLTLTLRSTATAGMMNLSVSARDKCRRGLPTPNLPITVHAPGVVTFNKPTAVFNNGDPEILTVASPTNGQVRFTGNGMSRNVFFPTLIPGPYPKNIMINYEFRDGNTQCRTFGNFIIQVKDPGVPEGIQLDVFQGFNTPNITFKTQADGVNDQWQWEWSFDNAVTSKLQSPLLKTPASPRSIDYTVKIKSDIGRKFSFERSFLLDFSYQGQQLGKSTQFSDLSNLGVQTIEKWHWDFGDGNTASIQHPSHTYRNPGSYVITLTITERFITYHLTKRIDIFPVVMVSPQAFYREDFNNGVTGWLSHGTVDSAGFSIDRSSWKLKTPTGFRHIPANKGNVWLTDNRDNPFRTSVEAFYNANEQSYVESPYFDITTLDRPTVSLSYWSDTDKGADGVVLLCTTDNGQSWFRIGQQNQGLNWYNFQLILGKPGNNGSNFDNQGWSGNAQFVEQQTWRTARFALDEVLQRLQDNHSSQKLIRFRVAFGSNADNPPNAQFDGFAFTDFEINNRNRLVLMEYFINQSIPQAAAYDLNAHHFAQQKTEIINLHYHTDFPGHDEANELNDKDPSGRAFHYGVRAVPRAVIDGATRDTATLGQWTEDIFFRHTLIAAPFHINIQKATANQGQLVIVANVTALRALKRKVVMQVVVVDTLTTLKGQVFHHVVRKMLPDASGTFRAENWQAGEIQDLRFTWDFGQLNPAAFKVVVFVEDYDSKEIHQAAVMRVLAEPQRNKNTPLITSVNKELSQQKPVKVYPNPAHHRLFIQLKPGSFSQQDIRWEIYNLLGELVQKGKVASQKPPFFIDTRGLKEGPYFIRLHSPHQAITQKFFIKH